MLLHLSCRHWTNRFCKKYLWSPSNIWRTVTPCCCWHEAMCLFMPWDKHWTEPSMALRSRVFSQSERHSTKDFRSLIPHQTSPTPSLYSASLWYFITWKSLWLITHWAMNLSAADFCPALEKPQVWIIKWPFIPVLTSCDLVSVSDEIFRNKCRTIRFFAKQLIEKSDEILQKFFSGFQLIC